MSVSRRSRWLGGGITFGGDPIGHAPGPKLALYRVAQPNQRPKFFTQSTHVWPPTSGHPRLAAHLQSLQNRSEPRPNAPRFILPNLTACPVQQLQILIQSHSQKSFVTCAVTMLTRHRSILLPLRCLALVPFLASSVSFKGYDGALNRFVAIKMLLPHLAVQKFSRSGIGLSSGLSYRFSTTVTPKELLNGYLGLNCAKETYTVSSVISPVLSTNDSVSTPTRFSIVTNRFDSGTSSANFKNRPCWKPSSRPPANTSG